MNEQLLVAACLKGNRESQQRLYEQFAPQMLGVCYRYAHSLAEAEDFLQEAFITIFRKLHQFRNEGSLEGWIRRIVVNTCLNSIKARYPVSESLDDLTIDHLNHHITEQQPNGEKDLISLVRALPDGYRTVFNLYAIEGYSHDEIAQMLGIKAVTSRSQYNRAREVLMKKLSADYPDHKKKGQNG